jgi:hypothetical protein
MNAQEERREKLLVCGATLQSAQQNDDFTRGVESQTFPLWPFLT